MIFKLTKIESDRKDTDYNYPGTFYYRLSSLTTSIHTWATIQGGFACVASLDPHTSENTWFDSITAAIIFKKCREADKAGQAAVVLEGFGETT